MADYSACFLCSHGFYFLEKEMLLMREKNNTRSFYLVLLVAVIHVNLPKPYLLHLVLVSRRCILAFSCMHSYTQAEYVWHLSVHHPSTSPFDCQTKLVIILSNFKLIFTCGIILYVYRKQNC